MKTFFELREATKENMPSVKTTSVAELAKKYDVDVSEVEDALEDGIEHEMEHTTDKSVAREIALDHLGDDLDYYEKLEDMEGEDDDEDDDDDDDDEVKESADKFIAANEYKGTKHTYKRRGNKMTSPIVVFINDKEWKEFATIEKAKKATIEHIKSMKEEKYSPQKHEWGKPESTRYAKKMTPGEEVKEDDDPCWDSYKQVGMKKKNGKKVPNCVPEAQERVTTNQRAGRVKTGRAAVPPARVKTKNRAKEKLYDR